jgi:hypothetical protein
VKESPSFPRRERRELRLTSLVVQFSDSRWTTAPHLPQAPDQTSSPSRPDSAPPAKDDIVGWPDEILIDFPDFPDCTLDSAAANNFNAGAKQYLAVISHLSDPRL